MSSITPKVFLRVQDEHDAISMHIYFRRLYHINSEINMHVFSCFGRLYHINSETDIHELNLHVLFHDA